MEQGETGTGTAALPNVVSTSHITCGYLNLIKINLLIKIKLSKNSVPSYILNVYICTRYMLNF